MTKSSFHGDAARELEEAAVYYESRVTGLGTSFLEEVERTVSLIERYPDAGAVYSRILRRVRLDRFPYSIVVGALVTGADGSRHANSALDRTTFRRRYAALRTSGAASQRGR